MRRSSFTWLFSLWLAVCALPSSSAARPLLCLPPLYEGGQRLHPESGSGVLWLELALRQHEVCWRSPRSAREKRIFLFGNSAIFGFPYPVEVSFGARLNQRFAADQVPAHLFNLGWVYTYMLRDSLILHESLPYEPDLVVYPLTLEDLLHFAPALFPLQLVEFFETNANALAELAAESPPGLVEPLRLYGPVIEMQRRFGRQFFLHLRETGTFARLSARTNATAIASQWAELPATKDIPRRRKKKYDCAKVVARFDQYFDHWQDWDVLAYLEQIQKERGIPVLVINWPSAYEPIGECYSARYTKAAQEQFDRWMAEQTRAHGLRYLDLHDLLEPEYFVDSLHVTPAGHEQVAEAIAPTLLSMIREGGSAGSRPGDR